MDYLVGAGIAWLVFGLLMVLGEVFYRNSGIVVIEDGWATIILLLPFYIALGPILLIRRHLRHRRVVKELNEKGPHEDD